MKLLKGRLAMKHFLFSLVISSSTLLLANTSFASGVCCARPGSTYPGLYNCSQQTPDGENRCNAVWTSQGSPCQWVEGAKSCANGTNGGHSAEKSKIDGGHHPERSKQDGGHDPRKSKLHDPRKSKIDGGHHPERSKQDGGHDPRKSKLHDPRKSKIDGGHHPERSKQDGGHDPRKSKQT